MSAQRKQAELNSLEFRKNHFTHPKVKAAAQVLDELREKTIEQLDVPMDIKVHPCGQYLYELWSKLSNLRNITEVGPQVISTESIYHYFKLVNYSPLSDPQWEIDTLLAMDLVWVNDYYTSRAKGQGINNNKG